MNNQTGFTLTEVMAAILLIVWLVLVGGLIYVAAHFISKFW